MKIDRLFLENSSDSDNAWNKTNILDHRRMMALSLYLAVEKNKNYMEVSKQLYANPKYSGLLYDQAGGLDGILKNLSNPLSVQDVARITEKEYDPKPFVLDWIKSLYPNIGTLGIQFGLLNYTHKFRTGKDLKLDDVKRNPKGAMSLFKQYGGYRGMIKYISTPEGLSELARLHQDDEFSERYIKSIISLLPGQAV